MRAQLLLAALFLAALFLVSAFVSAKPDHSCYKFLPTRLARCQGKKCHFGAVCSILKDDMVEQGLKKGDPACFCVNKDCSKAAQKDVCSSQRVVYKSLCEFKQAKCALRLNITQMDMTFCTAPYQVLSHPSDWKNVSIEVEGKPQTGQLQLPVKTG